MVGGHGQFDQAICILLDIISAPIWHRTAPPTGRGTRGNAVIRIAGHGSDGTRMATTAFGCLAYLRKTFAAFRSKAHA